MVNAAQITFFSGTGGVKRIADEFAQELACRDIQVVWNNLDNSRFSKQHKSAVENSLPAELNIVLFPLHAFDAPEPIYTWIRNHQFENQKAVVISVSGGGEMWPNTGCRRQVCQDLEQRGALVVYDHMMCMPSNWVVGVSDQVAMHLIRIIPHKVNRILDEVLAGKVRRSQSSMSSMRRWITHKEREYAREFPKEIKINDYCNGCGSCEGNCPVGNISMVAGRPVFNNQCIMCFRCIYACPSDALHTKNFMVLKSGYNLRDVEKRMRGVELEPPEKCASGWLWTAIRNYLLDRDFKSS